MIKKLIYYSSISLLVFWVISPMVLYVLGIEFSNVSFENAFKEIRFWGVPTCIFISLLGTIKLKDSIGKRTIKILITLGATFFAIIFMIMTVFTDMCNWTNKETLFINKETLFINKETLFINKETLFINKEDKSIKIIKREFGCGATDSDKPTINNFIIKEKFKYFISAKEISIEDIDKDKWMQFDN